MRRSVWTALALLAVSGLEGRAEDLSFPLEPGLWVERGAPCAPWNAIIISETEWNDLDFDCAIAEAGREAPDRWFLDRICHDEGDGPAIADRIMARISSRFAFSHASSGPGLSGRRRDMVWCGPVPPSSRVR